MRNLSYLCGFIFLVSCTSNTIFEEPKDLIPRDTMSLLVQEMLIASSSKFIKNKNSEKKVNYMPLVYDRFKIDSTRFQISNLYYMSKIDLYQDIMEDAKNGLQERKAVFDQIKKQNDSIRKESIEKNKNVPIELQEDISLQEDNIKVK